MTGLRMLLARLRGTLQRRRLDDQLDEEIRAHLDMQADELVRQGLAPGEARLAALRRFGGVEQIKEDCRDRRGVPLLESLARDLRYSLRLLGRTPGFAAIAVLTLSIGIGATTAIFTVLNRAFLQTLPVAQPDRIVALNNTAPNRVLPLFSYPNYADIRERTRAFSGLIAYRYAPLSVSHDGINERLWGFIVTGNYFDVLGVRPALGRLIAVSDDRAPGAHPVAVVSYRYWQQRLGGSPGVAGRTILANGRAYTIIGVAPQGFFGTDVVSAPELWFPMAMLPVIETGPDWLDDRGREILFVLGRLRDGVSAAQAQADTTAIGLQLEQEHPDNRGKRIELSTPGLFGNAVRGPIIGFAGLLLLIAALVLLLACTNLVNLLLARAADRRREMAVRLSLGAGRLPLIRQLLTESVLLSAAAGVVGLLLASWLVELAGRVELPIDVPFVIDLPIDRRVLAFTMALSALTGILFGLVPALQATKADLITALKDGGTGAAPRHESTWKKGLIVVQVAVSLVLLINGGLMLRGLARAETIPLGFTPERAAEVSFDLRLQGHEPSTWPGLQRRLLENLRALPGVRHAALADIVPVDLHFARARVYAAGAVPERSGRAPLAFTSRVTPGYFLAMDTPLEAGRDFTNFDTEETTPVAIVSRGFARRIWPGQDPIGRTFRLNDAEGQPLQVVGIAADAKYAGLNEEGAPMVYRPLWQSYSGSTTVVVRSDGDLATLIPRVQAEVHRIDPNIPIASARALTARLALPLLPARMTALLLGVFGVVALALAAIGLYGVMSYMVASRTREFGVRVAMGARSADVLALVLRQGLTLTAVGLLAGVGGALLLTPLMRALLYGVSSRDGLTYASVVGVLGMVALIACLVPARRATRLDPVEALRAG